MKKILAVHDISCVGRCSLTVVLPIVSGYGVECRILPTALLSTHTGGFSGFTTLDLTEEIKKILIAWQPLNLQFDAIYSGFMASSEQIDVLKTVIQTYSTSVIVDPVMGDNGNLYSVFDENYVEKMKELIPFADVLIPNITEACLLTGQSYREYQNESFIRTLIAMLKEQGAKEVVLTGIRLDEYQIGAASSMKEEINYYFADKISGNYHGTGDIFGSVLTAELSNGKSLSKATQEAVDFVVDCIKATPRDIEKRYGVNFEEILSKRFFNEE